MHAPAPRTKPPRSPWYFPGSYWFPAAAAYAALILPWSVLGQLGLVPAPLTLHSGAGHAHEMLFGYALAVVAGYTLVPGRGSWPAVLLLVWLAARVSWLLEPNGWWALAFNGAFVAGLVLLVAPTYLRATKWSNRAVALILAGLALAVFGFHATGLAHWKAPEHALLRAAVLLLSTLMFLMGGRILAPAIAGQVRAGGQVLKHVVQPGLEVATLALLGAAIALVLLPWRATQWAAAALLVLAAAMTIVRVWRWQVWRCTGQADLMALLAGYAWLPVGWLLVAQALLAQAAPIRALHAITVGALGTLTVTVMLRTQMARETGEVSRPAWGYAAALLMGAAALLRLAEGPRWTLVAAAACWSSACLLLLVRLWCLHGRKAALLRERANGESRGT